MTQQRISSIISVGREQQIDENFTELYTAVTAFDATSATVALHTTQLASASAAIGSVNTLVLAASAAAASASAAAAAASAAITAIGGAWTGYTPTLLPGSGTFTSATATAAYTVIGKTVHLRARVVITTNGTAAGSVGITLPSTANSIFHVGYGFRNGTNRSLVGTVGGSDANFRLYDGTYPGADGITLDFGITYEKQ